jgi:hypothetical protein
MKQVIFFDLDGILAESKSPLDQEVSGLLHDLLGTVKVAVISGGDWPQFEKQVLAQLPNDRDLHNLSLLPTCDTKFYSYGTEWKKIYSEDFTPKQKSVRGPQETKRVIEAFVACLSDRPQEWRDDLPPTELSIPAGVSA